ncbi:MAG: winged helix-turn-helix domain-containing protein [Chloroflexota bacterium]|nr:winged helix-turn-helix domain-containing protein [Anaerolineae bacterium]
MSTLTWLHLSDPHFRESDTYDEKIVLKTLREDIEKRIHEDGLQPEFIVITGDIAFVGKPREYGLACQFLDDLLCVTGIPKSHLFIVPGNHDIDREAVKRTPRLIAKHINESRSKEELRKRVAEVLDENRQLLLERFHHYADFVNDYFTSHLRFDDEHYFYTKVFPLGNLRIAILGLNTAWLSGADEENKKLVLGERQVRAAVEQTEGADLRIALLHHPFDWLHEYDEEDVEPLLKDSCDFVLRGHLHKTNLALEVAPDGETMEIAAGACYLGRGHPNSYNIVRLDLDAGKGKIVLRRFTDQRGGFWTQDGLTYRNVPNGVWHFRLSKRLTERLEVKGVMDRDELRPCLAPHGLRGNPFALWDASMEKESDIYGCFSDVGGFHDRLLGTRIPCVVLADPGLGKTAYRQTLAAQCRPLQRDSSRLALLYSYGSFERLLTRVNNDPENIRPIDHVNELLRQGLDKLEEEVSRGRVMIAELKQTTLGQPKILRHLSAHISRYAPQLAHDLLDGALSAEETSSVELLQAFSSLLRGVGLLQCLVLVDGLDEWCSTAGKPVAQVALLASLLGTLPLVQCQGWAFKFFLQQDTEPILLAQEWFKPDRMRIFRIQEWDENALQELISRRMINFSSKSSLLVESLAQLCGENLGESVGDELAHLAEGRPRWGIILADMLLRTYCQQDNPPALITQATWDTVKKEWPTRRADLLKDEGTSTTSQAEPESTEAVQPVPLSVSLPSIYPPLRLDEERGRVWVGEHEITGKITPQQYRVLVCLYQHQHDVCTKDLLAEEGWPGAERDGVSDGAIAACILRLRAVLRESSPHVDYIQTFKGRGYRLHPEGFKRSQVVVIL